MLKRTLQLSALAAVFLAVAALFPFRAHGQATRPIPAPAPAGVWFQPERNVDMLYDEYGVRVFLGPEVENRGALSPAEIARREDAWVAKVESRPGAYVMLKRPRAPVSPRCIGFINDADEAPSKGIPPAAMDADYQRLRALDPTMPIFMSVFGGQVTSANYDRPHELALIREYAARCDAFLVNVYPRNINASRHKDTWPGDACGKLRDATGRPVWLVAEMNDQQLPSPTSKTNGVEVDVNREPTPSEIRAQVGHAVARGATGLVWFPTCASGKYGWPQSYWPTVNRHGQGLQPQLDAVREISLARLPPAATQPTTKPTTRPAPRGVVAYAWHPADGVTPLVRVDMRESWRTQHDAAAAALLKRPAGRRALFIYADHPGLWWDAERSPRMMVADGPFGLDAHARWLRALFGRLADAGAVPDLIVLDNESAPTLWAFPTHAGTEAWLATILADPRARANLSPDVLAFTAADFRFGAPRYRDAFAAYGAWASAEHARALRGVGDQAFLAFRRDVPVVNYGDHASDVPGSDANGWPIPRATAGGTSAPVLYIAGDGHALRGRAKPARWNGFILAVNNLRAAAASGRPVRPWVSYPTWPVETPGLTPALWVELMRHVAATGVGEAFYFNPPGTPAADDALAARTFAGLDPAAALRTDLPQVPFDADEVRTGDVVTRAGEYER